MKQKTKKPNKIENIHIRDMKPEHNIVFIDNDNEVGCLNWDTGKLEFKGNMDESAKIFFNFLKGYIDNYLRENK